jgi:GT2 family glycosyltransferase
VKFYTATVIPVKSPSKANEMDYISGGCLFTAMTSFRTLGLLPERYFLYWEETDWCHRAKLQGFELRLCEKSVCYDKGSTSIGKSFIADYYYARNGLLFIHQFRRHNLLFVLFLLSLRFLKRIFTGRWDRAKGIYQGTLDFLNRRK